MDELTGFISAVALVRPSKAVADVTPSSVRKKMKDRRVCRGGAPRGPRRMALRTSAFRFEEHVAFVMEAMAANAGCIGPGRRWTPAVGVEPAR